MHCIIYECLFQQKVLNSVLEVWLCRLHNMKHPSTWELQENGERLKGWEIQRSMSYFNVFGSWQTSSDVTLAVLMQSEYVTDSSKEFRSRMCNCWNGNHLSVEKRKLTNRCIKVHPCSFHGCRLSKGSTPKIFAFRSIYDLGQILICNWRCHVLKFNVACIIIIKIV